MHVKFNVKIIGYIIYGSHSSRWHSVRFALPEYVIVYRVLYTGEIQ